jgi:hypothetical protein
MCSSITRANTRGLIFYLSGDLSNKSGECLLQTKYVFSCRYFH